MTPTPDEMARWRALCEAATPGDWVALDNDGPRGNASVWTRAEVMLGGRVAVLDAASPHHNAAFIAAARSAVPRLLAEVERLKRDAETAWANEAATSELLRETKAERDALATRRDELLAAMVRVTRETPYPDEAGNAGVLLAEVGTLKASLAATQRELAEARAEVERLRERVCCAGEPHTCEQEAIAAAQAKTDRAVLEIVHLSAMHEAACKAVSAECMEHVQLNGHIETATFAHDYLMGERDKGDPSGRLADFVASLEVVIDEVDRQRRRANWYEAGYTASKQKLIDHAVDKATAPLISELQSSRTVVAAAEAHHEAESAEIGISIDDASDAAVRIRQRKWKTLDALRAAIDHHRTRKL